MFEDSLLESGGRLKTQRGRTTTFAIILEIGLIGLMVLMPLIFTEALPKQQLMTFLVAPPPPPPPPPPAAAPVHVVHQIQTDIVNGALRTPTKIPQKIQMIKEDEAPPSMASSGVVGGVPGGIPGGQMGGVIGGIISSTPVAVPKVAAPQRVRVSQGVSQGLLVRKVNPVYPPLARQARVSGTVVLRAIIGTDGSIENLTLVSGHPMLAPAAIEAVKQWKYRPYLLNGNPIKVDTEVTVNFALSPSPNDAVAGAAVRPEETVSEYMKKYPGLLTEFGQLLEKLQRNIQLPPARDQSRILPLLPESTILYAAFPNYGDAAHQALTIFQQEVQQNAVLRDWWEHSELGANGPKVEGSLEKAYQLSQYLGDEIVLSGTGEIGEPGAAMDPNLMILAEVRKPGLKDFLQQITKELAGNSEPAVRVLDVEELAASKDAGPAQQLVILVRPDLMAGAHDVATLRYFNARLNARSRGFAST